MGWRKKSEPAEQEQAQEPSNERRQAPQSNPQLPGTAGYSGYGLRKNAMPENRFKFVRPDSQRHR